MSGSLLFKLKQWARTLKRDVVVVYFAARHPETPLVAKCLAFLVAAYALSPIDLIPDFIPVLGYLDDLIIVPLGLWWVMRLLPESVLTDSRIRAQALLDKPRNYGMAALFVMIWFVLGFAIAYWFYRR